MQTCVPAFIREADLSKFAVDVGYINKLPNLQQLSLDGVYDDDLACLSNLPHLTCLKVICGQFVTNVGLAHIATVTTLSRLELTAAYMITSDGLAPIATLNLLDFRLTCGYKLTDAAIVHVSTLANLTTLDLSYCHRVTDTGFMHLAKLQHLQSLTVRGGARLRTCVETLEYDMPRLQLQHLDLQECFHLTDEDLEHLTRTFVNVLDLNLKSCLRVTDAGLQHVARLRHLRRLDLGFCNFHNHGLQHLVALPSLQYLNLFRNRFVTDLGVAYLTSIASLTHLNVKECVNVSAGVAQELAGVGQFSV